MWQFLLGHIMNSVSRFFIHFTSGKSNVFEEKSLKWSAKEKMIVWINIQRTNS